MVEIPTVRDALTRFKLTLSPAADLLEAVELLVARRSHGAPVVDEDGRLIGVLTEKDCLRVLSGLPLRELAGGAVRDHMSTVRAAVTIEMDLFRAAQVFLEGNFPILPVLDQGRLVGRISRLDLLKLVQELDRSLEREHQRMEDKTDERERPNSIERLQRLAGSYDVGALSQVLHNRPRR